MKPAHAVVYHGTSAEFTQFKKPELNRMADRAAIGFWFTTSQDDAKRYGQRIIEASLKTQNLKSISIRELDFLAVSEPMPAILKKLKAQGYDGLHIQAVKADPALDEKGQPEQYVVFDAKDIEIIGVENKLSNNLEITPSPANPQWDRLTYKSVTVDFEVGQSGIAVFDIASRERRCGHAKEALQLLRQKFGQLHAEGVVEEWPEALGFWQQMVNDGIADSATQTNGNPIMARGAGAKNRGPKL